MNKEVIKARLAEGVDLQEVKKYLDQLEFNSEEEKAWVAKQRVRVELKAFESLAKVRTALEDLLAVVGQDTPTS